MREAKPVLTEDDLSEELEVSPSTLRHWRATGSGPPYVKMGGRLVRYLRQDVDAWLGEHRQEATA